MAIIGLIAIPAMILLSEENIQAKAGATIGLLASLIGLPFIVKDIKRKKMGLLTGVTTLVWLVTVLFIGYVR